MRSIILDKNVSLSVFVLAITKTKNTLQRIPSNKRHSAHK
ncbi:hypothetical protein [Citrobacter freundii]|uniref:Uncharacterized protein n=1 Tax=Citrobacter freundii TaxID=546 RepID=A0A7G2IV58_CITFR|nr:hypothetical protein [Citrobacter freundii]